MTDTTVTIPDYVTMTERTISDLAVIMTGLLTEAQASGLTLPRHATLACDELRLQFGNTPDAFSAIAAWADCHGSRNDITIRLNECFEDGPRMHAEFTFASHGVIVQLYAYIKTDPVT
jgi:hypothetical protein